MQVRIRSSGRSAFATVEALVASAIVALSAVSLYAGVSFGFGLLQSARENLRATQILQEKLELVRLYNWSQVNTSGFIPRTFTEPLDHGDEASFFTGTIEVADSGVSEPYQSDLRMVTVTIEWTSLGRARSRQMQTFVSRYGIQNYIF